MTTETTNATTNEPEVGSAVQIRHGLVQLDGSPDPAAGLHGSIVGRDPFGGYLIKIGHHKPEHFGRQAFIVTAAPGATPADAPATTQHDAGQPASVRLVQAEPLQAINSPTNPRRRRGLDLDSLRTLADSITTHGLAQPILVRPLPASRLGETSALDPRPAYEVVAGERRWRAAQLAELPTMPMLVRDLTDGAVLEIQLVENIEREDMDPMEEAEGFQLLREKLGYTVEQIADKMGKGRGPSYVRKRMKLLDLTPESREAMYDGTLQLSTGLLVARYPAAKQAAAIKHIAGMATRAADGTLVPAPFREVSLALYRKFATILKTAPFDTTDPGLVFNAGPCSTCSKRTRAHEDLFADHEGHTDAGEDSCLDSACWGEKKTAHVARATADAQARGLQVLEEAEALKVAPSPWSSYRTGYVSIDATAYWETGDDGEEREVTYADALRAQGRKAAKPVVMINPHTSKVEELLPDDLAKKLLPKAVQDNNAKNAAAAQQRIASEHARMDNTPPEVKAMRRHEVIRAVMFRLFDGVRQRPRSIDELRLIAEQTIAHRSGDDLDHLEVYMGWVDKHDAEDPTAYLHEKIGALDADQLGQVITMAAMEDALTSYYGRYDDEAEAVAYVQAQGIDVLAVRDKVDEDLQRAQTPTPSQASPTSGGGGSQPEDDDAPTDADAAEEEDQDSAPPAAETDPAVGAADGGQHSRATSPDAGAAHPLQGEPDDLVDAARTIVVDAQNASISFVQRKLNIGYNRAARLLETLEQQGVVGPLSAAGVRDVLVEGEQA